MLLLPGLTGCAGSDRHLSLGAPEGTAYSYAACLAQQLSQSQNSIVVDVVQAADDTQCLEQLDQGQMQLAVVQSDLLNYAYTGTELWQGQKTLRHVAALASLYPLPCLAVVDASLGVDSLSAAAGLRLSLGKGVQSITSLRLLAACGLDEEAIVASYEDTETACAQMLAGELDGFFFTGPLPEAAVLALHRDKPLTLLSLGQQALTALFEEYPCYISVTLDQDDYPFIRGEQMQAAVTATLVCRVDLEQDTASSLLEKMFGFQPQLAEVHQQGRFLNKEFAVRGVAAPFHSAAESYFAAPI